MRGDPWALLNTGSQKVNSHLKGLLVHLGLNSASVEILPGQSHSNSVAVVNRARERFEQVPRDRVFALMDAEQDDLEQAIRSCREPLQIGNQKKAIPEICIEPIISSPCFEVWLLLHFRFSINPFEFLMMCFHNSAFTCLIIPKQIEKSL